MIHSSKIISNKVPDASQSVSHSVHSTGLLHCNAIILSFLLRIVVNLNWIKSMRVIEFLTFSLCLFKSLLNTRTMEEKIINIRKKRYVINNDRWKIYQMCSKAKDL